MKVCGLIVTVKLITLVKAASIKWWEKNEVSRVEGQICDELEINVHHLKNFTFK
jgi:hypothetical protein